MRPLWLWGFMATGKSTLGRRIAELAGVPFRDLDEHIATRAGLSVPELFRTRGEAGFRALEREALLSSFHQPGVLALGGGTLLSRELRLRALDECTLVTLRARPETLLERTTAGGRPLLEGPDRATRLEELLEARALAYSECHAQIDTTELELDIAARTAIEIWRRDPIAVAAGARSYTVDVGHGIGEASIGRALSPRTSVFAVTDANVETHHGAFLRKLAGSVHVLTPGEEHKTPATLEGVWRAASAAKCDRASVFLGFGGGVVTDIAGFAAATYLRGVPWVSAPTTLLGAVDAAVGGKTGVDLGSAKNAVGAFWQPRASICDLAFLATEPERGFRSALSEVVKAALIGDPALLTLLETSSERVLGRDPETLADLTRRAIRVKARIVSRDERESRLRAVLNLGHTVGHALEAHSDYTRYTHGEAISLGLVAALQIGERLGVTSGALAQRVQTLLLRLGLPAALDPAELEPALGLLGHDKKRTGNHIRVVLVREVGQVELHDLELPSIARAAL